MRFVFFALWLTTSGQIGIDLYSPSMPAIAEGLATSNALVQLTLTLYLLPWALSLFIYGPLSDAWGRKPIVYVGLGLYLLGALAATFAPNIGILLASRVVQGVGIGAPALLSRALTRDVFDGPRLHQVSAYQGMAWGTVPLIAPVIGGHIQHWLGWRANFGLLTLLGIALLLSILFFLPETKDRGSREPFHSRVILANYLKLLRNPNVVGSCVTLFFLYGQVAAFVVGAPFLLQQRLGATPVLYGYLFLIVAAGHIVGAYLNSRLVTRLPIRPLTLTSALLSVLANGSMLIFALFGLFTITTLILPMTISMIGIGIAYTNCAAQAMRPFPRIAGSAGALAIALAFCGGTLASLLIAYLPEATQLPLAATLFGLSLFALASLQLLAFRKTAPL